MKIANILKDLRIYSFNSENLIKCINSRDSYNIKKDLPVKKTAEIKKKHNSDFFIPQQKDSLFWCWYIFKNGIDEYDTVSNKYFTIEKSRKIKFVEKIRKATFEKSDKIKKKEVELNLANDCKLNLKSLEAMLLCKHENFIYIDDFFYREKLEERP